MNAILFSAIIISIVLIFLINIKFKKTQEILTPDQINDIALARAKVKLKQEKKAKVKTIKEKEAENKENIKYLQGILTEHLKIRGTSQGVLVNIKGSPLPPKDVISSLDVKFNKKGWQLGVHVIEGGFTLILSPLKKLEECFTTSIYR